jgi:hypothetical protein
MVQLGGRLHLAMKPLDCLFRADQLPRQDLDRHLAPHPAVPGAVNHAHAPFAQRAENLVMPEQQPARLPVQEHADLVGREDLVLYQRGGQRVAIGRRRRLSRLPPCLVLPLVAQTASEQQAEKSSTVAGGVPGSPCRPVLVGEEGAPELTREADHAGWAGSIVGGEAALGRNCVSPGDGDSAGAFGPARGYWLSSMRVSPTTQCAVCRPETGGNGRAGSIRAGAP